MEIFAFWKTSRGAQGDEPEGEAVHFSETVRKTGGTLCIRFYKFSGLSFLCFIPRMSSVSAF